MERLYTGFKNADLIFTKHPLTIHKFEEKSMTIAQKRATSPKLDNRFLSSLQKQFPELIPPAIAILIFLTIWQLFSWTPGATLPGPIQVVQDTWILDFVSLL